MAKRKSAFDYMNDFLEKNNRQRQMDEIQHNEIGSYEKPDLFSQMDEMFKQKEQPKIDWSKELKPKFSTPKKKPQPKNEPFLTDVKNFFTGKDTDGDGQRNGLLGAIDRFVLPISKGATEVIAPGNNERMIQNDILKHGKVTNPVNKASLVNRGTETKVLEGAGTMLGYVSPYGEGYKAANLAFNKLPKLAKTVTNPYAQRAIKGGIAGLTAETGLAAENELFNSKANNMSDYGKRIAFGTVGGAVGDPLLHGIGQGISKGSEKYASNVMGKLVPKGETIANEMAKAYKADNALPIQNKNQELTQLFDDFIQSRQPKAPTTTKEINVPKIGQSVDELPPLNEFSALDRSTVLDDTPRPKADFTNAKPVIEQPDNVNVYGVEVPKGDLVETAPPEYWQKRYEEFVDHVNKNYDTNQLNREALDDLWSQFARYDEPVTLEQVVDMAYNGYKGNNPIDTAEVWDQFGNRPPVSKNAKKIMGMDANGQPKVKPVEEPLPEMTIKRTVYKPSQQAETPQNINTLEQPSNAVNDPVNVPKPQENIPKVEGERSFYNTVGNSEKISPELAQRLEEFDKSYTPMSNEELVQFANDYVAKDMEKAYQFVKNARKFDPRHITVGHRLIDELQKAGEYDRALDVVERLAEQGTKAGQSIQSYSIYNRLSVEGQLLRAQRRVNQINENITDPNKKVKLTPETMDNISHTADSIKRFTGQEEQANDVMKIMENIKKGNHPTDAELETVRSFVSDAKKFVGDLTPNAKPPKVKPVTRNRDKVVDFMSKREEVARERLRQRMNRANSLPVDVFYDLSIIGASKIAKGTVKLADFTEEMAKEFGDMVRPYAQQLYNKAVETFNLQSESISRQRLSEVEKITNKALKDKNLSDDEAEVIREFAKRVGSMTGDAKLDASMELQATLQALERPTFGQKISTAQTIAQLLNPKTIVRNAIGNELFYRVEQMNKLIATPIDMVRSKITGNQRTITFRSFNQGQYWKNWMAGAKAGWKGVNPMGLTTSYDLRPQTFKGKYNPLTYLEKSLGATLRSFDYAGYMRAYNKTIGELANLRAINEGLKGKELKEAAIRYSREANENIQHIADAYGKYATFQDTTALSNALTKVKKGMNKVSTLGATEDFGLGDLVLKYPKTPGNLIMRALEYSPAGVVRSANLLRSMRKTKNPNEIREFWLSLTRAITGTGGFSLLGYALADKGILTSGGNSDYEVAALERNAGKQPNSVNVSALNRFIASGFNLDTADTKEGDTFVSYDWAQPISIAIALGTGVDQGLKETENPDIGNVTKGAVDSATNTIINQSVLKGLNDFLANYPGRTMSDRVGDAGKGIVGSFVPTLSNQVKQISDNTSRNTYSPKLLDEVKNRAYNRIPKLEKSLPPSFDTLGNKKQTFQNGSNNAFNVFLNPSFVSKYKPSKEAKFVLDYINKTGDKTAAPRLAPKTLDGKSLTSAQYTKMQRIMGEEVKKGLKVSVPRLEGSTDFERIKKEMDKILGNAGKKAREAIRQERGE